MMRIPPLNELLAYKNPLVIRRFKSNYAWLADQAEKLFEDLLKYLWLSIKHGQDARNHQDSRLDFSCVMHEEMREIDEMWHTFILITKDYADFCEKYFGGFIHHVPEMGGNADVPVVLEKEQFEKELRLFLSYTYDHLGEATVRSWFKQHLV